MQQHSTPVKQHTPKLHIPSLCFPPELNSDTTFVQHHPSLQAWTHPPSPWSHATSGSHLSAPDYSSLSQQAQIVESSVIEKQQKELELLIQELKDRDDELNDLVRIQQGQVAAWTEDRQMVLQLEERCLQLQGDIESRDQQVMLLKSNLAESQNSDQEKTAQSKALEAFTTPLILQAITCSMQHTLKLRQCIAERERTVDHCRNLEASISRLERSERSLQAIIAEKDAELQSFSQKLETGNAETQSKMKELWEALQQARGELRHCQEKQQSWEKEGERREGELLKARKENESLQSKLVAACQQAKQLETQLNLSGECDRRREQLLQLQRSRTERCSAELETLKTICSHQQQELLALKLNHTTSIASLRRHGGSMPLETQHSLEAKGAKHKHNSKPDSDRADVSTHSKLARAGSGLTTGFLTSELHPGDTSFTSMATADELSQLLNESSIERHLSGQLDSYEDSSTHTRQWNSMERTWPQLGGKGHKYNVMASTSIHQPSCADVPDFKIKSKNRPFPTSPKEGSKLSATKTHRAHDRKQTEPSNPLLIIPVQTPESLTGADNDDDRISGVDATDTGGDSPLSLDLDHLALQVRDKLSSIFDYSPTPPMEPPVLLPAANESRKPSKSAKSSPLERATRETGEATRGIGKSTSIKIMKPLQPVRLLGKKPTNSQSS